MFDENLVLKLIPPPATRAMTLLKNQVNDLLKEQEPWKIAVTSASATLISVWIGCYLTDGKILDRLKVFVFKNARLVPAIARRIKKEKENTRKEIQAKILKHDHGLARNLSLPHTGLKQEQIIKDVEKHLNIGDYKWDEGSVSGTVYHGGRELTDLSGKVYSLAMWTNPLHADVFPGIRKMEAEIVQMAVNLYHGNEDACGTMTSGGTESILMACKTFRDYAREVKGIKRPNIVSPVTAHAAFDKAAHLLNIDIVHIPLDRTTLAVDVKAMKKAINRNTCLLVGSCPNFPHGIIDPIEEISELGVKYKIPVHVDCCLGGFLVPFMTDAGFELPLFDFRLPGVSSISADTHKYGFAPKGSSVIMYSSQAFRHFQYFVQPDWPGGIYASPSLAGSRAGGIIAGCWASLLSFGRQGYVGLTRDIISTARVIKDGLSHTDGIHVMGDPQVSVVAFKSDVVDVFEVGNKLEEKGWNLNSLQYPSSVHICVTVLHTRPGVAERFIADVRQAVEFVMNNASDVKTGTAALYGMAQQIPDRSLVSEFAWCYLDELYNTKTITSGPELPAGDSPNEPALRKKKKKSDAQNDVGRKSHGETNQDVHLNNNSSPNLKGQTQGGS